MLKWWKKLPGLIWTSAILGYLFKRFGPDEPAVWAHSVASKSRTLVGDAPPLAPVGRSLTDEGTEIP
jgi:hypothetical protein